MIMRVAVLANMAQRQELTATGLPEGTKLIWVNTVEEFLLQQDVSAFFDLLFEPGPQRINDLKTVYPKPVFINDVLNKKPGDAFFIRFNGWPGFLERKIFEASCHDEELKASAEKIISALNRTAEWVPDTAGFISARVVSMIINEAFFALGEGVSSKKEIDLAMKWGANYPYGPFEWGEKIGLKNIYALLAELSQLNKRYEPAPLLKKETLALWH
jgi:3-hydroxybutyryl-CoA dehydrogenase